MLRAGEELFGTYVWGIYDLLVMPFSFASGGMEHPCVNFMSPTLLSGDKANAHVVAHEIAHSWTGNLVTNINMQHFWLNEGFTMFLERKILAQVEGVEARDFSALDGWSILKNQINSLGDNNNVTKLVTNLEGVEPSWNKGYSMVQYMKGAVFLRYLEQLVGETKMDDFLRIYIKKFSKKSIDSDAFKSTFINHFGALPMVDWDTWLYSPGMPVHEPVYDKSVVRDITDLAKKWLKWDPEAQPDFSEKTFAKFKVKHKKMFLNKLLEEDALSTVKIQKMAEFYKLDNSKDVETRFLWLSLSIKVNQIQSDRA